jgi:galactokinase
VSIDFASVPAQTFFTFAPGRVNLIGEHTDYSGGLVLPVAIDRGVTVRWRRERNAIRLRSAAFPEPVELATDGTTSSGPAGWGRYPAAVATLLHERGRPAAGLDGVVSSTVPTGAGLSSSAALTVAVGLALCRAAGFELPRLALAHVARDAEHRAVGVPVGLMDPAASLLAHRGHALLLDCATEEHRLVPLPEDLAVVVLDSGIHHQLEHSGYATRRVELEQALPALRGARPSR